MNSNKSIYTYKVLITVLPPSGDICVLRDLTIYDSDSRTLYDELAEGEWIIADTKTYPDLKIGYVYSCKCTLTYTLDSADPLEIPDWDLDIQLSDFKLEV